tara:strand:- start:2122 stop:4842 length:2721 start_codon:yes stop_codon:yes gene_type:complete
MLSSQILGLELSNWQQNSIIQNTIIDASSTSSSNPNGSCIIIRPHNSGESSNPTIQGFKIKNGKGTLLREELDFDGGTNLSHKYGGGLLVFKSSATIKHNIFQNNGIGNDDVDVEMGGGVFAYDGDGMDFEDFILSNSIDQNSRNSINFIENLFEGNYANIGKTISSKTDSEAELNLTFTGCIFDYAFDDGANGKVSDYWCKSDENSIIQFNLISGLSNAVSTDLYVSNDGLETNDGSENNPLGTIKSAMERIYVSEGDNLTINLEAGTYLGDRSSGFPIQALNRVLLKGSNDIEDNPTILDGSENTTLIKSESVHEFKLENIVLFNGKASSENEGGGALNIRNSNIEMDNIELRDNQSTNRGGALFGLSSDIELKNSSISRNVSSKGGAIYLSSSNMNIINSHFEESFSEDGGAVYIENESNISIENGRIEYSVVEDDGGAIYSKNSIINLSNGLEITDNVSNGKGGGVYLENSILNANDIYINYSNSDDKGAALYANETVINCINININTNFTENDGGGFYINNSEVDIENSFFNDNESSEVGGSLFLKNSSVNIRNTHFYENESDDFGGALNIDGGINNIENSFFNDNEGNEYSGAINIEKGSNVIIENSFIIDNKTGSNGYGGGLTILGDESNPSNLRIENTTIAYNTSRHQGGGLYIDGAKVELVNSNVLHNGINSFDEEGGGIYIDDDSQLFIINSNMWDNEPEQIFGFDNDDIVLVINHSNIMNNEYGLDENSENLILIDGLINSNPLFIDEDEYNFILMPESPCIDAGIDFYIYENDTIINLGTNDYYGASPDIGAIEYGFLGTYEQNLIPNQIIISDAYPNPFNPSTSFNLYSPREERLDVMVYNIDGAKVIHIDNEKMNYGLNKFVINMNHLPSGIYVVKFVNQSIKLEKKITLIK